MKIDFAGEPDAESRANRTPRRGQLVGRSAGGREQVSIAFMNLVTAVIVEQALESAKDL